MSYRSLARAASPGFFVLGFLGRLPAAMGPLGTLVLLADVTGSYTFAGLASAAQSLAMAGASPLVGVLADRFGHRLVGVVSAIGNALALLGVVAASRGDRPLMLMAAVLAGLLQAQTGTLVRVHWTRLLTDRRVIQNALSYEAAADDLCYVAGPAIVGLLGIFGPAVPVLVASAVLLCAAVPFAAIYARGGSLARSVSKAALPKWPMTAMFLAMVAMGAVFGAVQTGVTAFATSNGDPAAAGLLYAEMGVGSALAGLACGWLPLRFALVRRYVTFAVLLFAGCVALLVVRPLPVAIVLTGLTVAPYMISLYGLTNQLAPAQRATVAMTILCAGGPVGTALGRAASGTLADSYGSFGAFAVAPVVMALAVVLAVIVGKTSVSIVSQSGPGIVSGMSGLRERKKLLTRQAILNAAESMFAERGFDNVTVAEIADSVNVSAKTVFVYFAAKEDLAFAGEAEMRDTIVACVRDRAAGQTPLDAMGDFLRDQLSSSGGAVNALDRLLRTVGDSTVLQSRMRLMWEHFENALAVELATETHDDPYAPTPRIAAAQLILILRTMASPEVMRYVRAHPKSKQRAAFGRWLSTSLSLVGSGISTYAPR